MHGVSQDQKPKPGLYPRKKEGLDNAVTTQREKTKAISRSGQPRDRIGTWEQGSGLGVVVILGGINVDQVLGRGA